MGIEYASVVDAPVEEVFGWHARPGAVTRLMPPWQPVRVAAESASLRDGRAVLVLPGRLRWVAEHEPAGHRPPYGFADRLVSRPLRAVLPWSHRHEFAAAGADRTRVTDRVQTPLPAGLLRPMFAYRHRQLAADLAAHGWAARAGGGPLTVAVTGSSGLVGSALVAYLSTGGHRVIRLVRGQPRGPGERLWRPDDPAGDLLTGVDAVVHLAGAGVAGRFTAAHRRAIRDSRVGPTRRLAELAGGSGVATFVCAGGIHYYGYDRGDELLTETSSSGDGFLAGVVAEWEAATAPAQQAGVRLVVLRTGVVLHPRGGMLRALRPLFAAGLGGRLGSGRQWLSWIGLDDMLDVVLRALVDRGLSGAVNAVAPHPVRNAEFARTLARVMHRPALLPVPAAGPRLVLGAAAAREIAESNVRAAPQRLLDAAHPYRHPRLEPALRHVLGRDRRPAVDPDADPDPTG